MLIPCIHPKSRAPAILYFPEAVLQDELVVLLGCVPDERAIDHGLISDDLLLGAIVSVFGGPDAGPNLVWIG